MTGFTKAHNLLKNNFDSPGYKCKKKRIKIAYFITELARSINILQWRWSLITPSIHSHSLDTQPTAMCENEMGLQTFITTHPYTICYTVLIISYIQKSITRNIQFQLLHLSMNVVKHNNNGCIFYSKYCSINSKNFHPLWEIKIVLMHVNQHDR